MIGTEGPSNHASLPLAPPPLWGSSVEAGLVRTSQLSVSGRSSDTGKTQNSEINDCRADTPRSVHRGAHLAGALSGVLTQVPHTAPRTTRRREQPAAAAVYCSVPSTPRNALITPFRLPNTPLSRAGGGDRQRCLYYFSFVGKGLEFRGSLTGPRFDDS